MNRKYRRSKKIINDLSTKLKKTDKIYNLFSKFINPNDLLKLFIFSNKLTDNTFKELHKYKEQIKLKGIDEHFQKFMTWIYRKKINQFVDNMSPEQIVLISEGKYDKELYNKFIYNKEPPPVNLNIEQKAKTILLKSIFARTLRKNIKSFIKSLTNDELVLLINGKFNLNNALYNSFLHTEYPTIIEPKLLKDL